MADWPTVGNLTAEEVATWLKNSPPVVDPWGMTVVLANPQKNVQFADPMENRAAHLLGEEIRKGTEQRQLDPEKQDWIGAVRQTISDAQVRVRSDSGAETLYFRNYKEGTHMVVTADGMVKDQKVLISQYAPELSKKEFRDAVVEQTQLPRQAPQGSPGTVGIRTQP